MLENLEMIFKCCLYLTGIVALLYIVVGVIFDSLISTITKRKSIKKLKEVNDALAESINEWLKENKCENCKNCESECEPDKKEEE
jgi:hypothetical protein